MTMIAIAAMSTNRVIGNNNTLPWSYPADLQRFKKLTTSHTVVMGRKTFESIAKPLPNRHNIVLTHNTSRVASGVEVVHETETLLQKLRGGAEGVKTYIIGGAQIYQELLPYCDYIELTLIKKDYEGDTHFPPFEKNFHEIRREKHDEYDFISYAKNE